MTATSKDSGKHDSGKTSQSSQSGKGGKHSVKADGFHAGGRHVDPRMHPDGWSSR
jgi:hypothetical protein